MRFHIVVSPNITLERVIYISIKDIQIEDALIIKANFNIKCSYHTSTITIHISFNKPHIHSKCVWVCLCLKPV